MPAVLALVALMQLQHIFLVNDNKLLQKQQALFLLYTDLFAS